MIRLDRLATALRQDVFYASRAIRSDLRPVLFGMLIVGLGLGASTAIFSVMSPLMLRPLPFAEPDRLVWIANSDSGGMSAVTSRTSNLRDFRRLSQSFEGLTGYNAFFEEDSTNLVGQGEPERLVGVDVAHDFLDVLGIQPEIGRSFLPEEGAWGGPPAAILTQELWQRRFGGDPEIVGSTLSFDNVPTEVVGVLPASFDFSEVFAPRARVDFLRPFPISDETDRWGNTLSMIGRLKPDSSVTSAQAELDQVLEALRQDDPERWGLQATVSGLQERIARPYRTGLWLLAAAAAVLMLIVCVNLSNLLLARGPRRSQEMALRSALGAPRSRLLRQLLVESLMSSLGGALIGVLIAVVVTRTVAASPGIDIPLLRTVSVDWRALLFALGAAVLTGLLVGLLPALRVSQGREAGTIKTSLRGASADRGSRRLLEGLVVAEIALACGLVVFGGLLLKSFQKVLDVDLGFETEKTVAWKVNPSRSFEDLAQANAYFDRLVTEIEAVPGVEAVGLTDAAPLGRNRSWAVRAPGREYGDKRWLDVFPHIIDRRYLEALEIPLLAGRHFTQHDTLDNPNVLLLNASAAHAIYHGEEVLGRTVLVGGRELEVIGVVADVRHLSLEQGSGLELYLPITQSGDFSTLDMVVRSSLPVTTLAEGVAAAVHAVDPTVPTHDFQALGAAVDRSVSPRRFTLMLLTGFAATALLLAALGIYSLLSYNITERNHEIGIRMALGESGAQVRRRVVGRTLLLAAAGTLVGCAGALALSRTLESLLFGVQPTDTQTLVGTALVLFAVSVLAGWAPAQRASRIDPAKVLRQT